jgi:hypothetical protein
MTSLRFEALSEETARAFQAGASDANGQPPERHISDGSGNPCRHCLEDIPEGEPFLILAHRPFPAPQPYAEVGPIFLHAEACDRYDGAAGLPAMLLDREHILIRGYGQDDRIVDGSGQVIPTADLVETAAKLFERPDIAYLHLRSATNNCYQCRIDRA